MRTISSALVLLAGAHAFGDDTKRAEKLPAGAKARIEPLAYQYRPPFPFLSPDGKLQAVADAKHVIHVTAADTGKELFNASGHRAAPRPFFSPDGKWLATVSNDALLLWEVSTGKLRHNLAQPNYAIYRLAFSPDGKTLAAATQNKSVELFDLEEGRKAGTLAGHGQHVHAVAFSPDGKLLASGSADGIARVWDWAAEKELARYKELYAQVLTVSFTPDGKALVVGEESHVWEWETDHVRFRVRGDSGATFSPDGKLLATMEGGTPVVMDATTGKNRRQLDGGLPAALRFSPDGKKLLDVGPRRQVWDVETGKRLAGPSGLHSGGVACMALSPDGRLVATGGADRVVGLWDAAAGKLVRSWVAHEKPVQALAFAGNDRLLSAAAGEGVKSWGPATGKELVAFGSKADGQMKVLAVSADGRLAAHWGMQQRLGVWETATGKEVETFFGTMMAPRVAVSPGGRLVAGAAAGRTSRPAVTVWDVTTGRERVQVEWPTAGTPIDVAIAPDDRAMYLFTAIAGGPDAANLRVVELATGQDRLSHPLPGLGWGTGRSVSPPPLPGTTTVSFGPGLSVSAASPDRRLLAVGIPKGTILLWDTITGRKWHEFHTGSGFVVALAFSADGRALASLGADHSVLVWDMAKVRPLPQEPPPGPRPEPADWWKELAADDAARAYRALWLMGADPEQALPVLKQHLAKPAPEPGEAIRQIRAAEVLEQIGTPEARRLLEAMAQGAARPAVRRDARAALDRLGAAKK